MTSNYPITQSIAKVYIGQGHCTGWFCSGSKAILITCGHLLSTKKSNEKIKIEYRGQDFNAEVLDLGYEPEKFIDYAILQVKNIKAWNHIPISTSAKTGGQIKYYCKGYRENDEIIFSTEGNILSNQSKGGTWILELSENSGYVKHGISGAPICVIEDGIYYCVGIQIKQNSAAPYSRIMALSLKTIERLSEKKEVFTESKNQFYAIKAFSSKDFFLPHSKSYSGSPERLNVILYTPPQEGQKLYNVYSDFINQWKHFTSELNNSASTIKFVKSTTNYLIHPKEIPVSISKGKKPDIVRIEESLGFEYDSTRIIINFSAHKLSIPHFKSKCSHLIGIGFSDGPKFDLKEFDHAVYLNNDQEIIHSMYNVISDIYLDSICFNSLTGIKQIFNSIDLKRKFSTLKVEYAVGSGYKSYGRKIIETQCYLSIASLIRTDEKQKLDFNEYYMIWSRFLKHILDNFSLINLNPGFHFTLDDIKDEKEFRKYFGQISSRAFNKQRKSLVELGHEYGILVLCTKKPREKIDLMRLRNSLKVNKLRIPTTKVFPLSQLQHLLAIKRFLKILVIKL